MKNITRFGISLPQDILQKYDGIIRKNGYSNRSKAILDLIRNYIKKETTEKKYHYILQIYYNHRHIKEISEIENSYPCTIKTSFNQHVDLNFSYKIITLFGEKKQIQKITEKYKKLGNSNDISVKVVSEL